MKTWNELTHYAGFDWAGDHHDVVIVDPAGQRVAQFRFEHSAEGWEQFRQQTQAYAGLGVAVETRSGAAVEELLRSDCTVFPVQPKAAARYRERKAPSGVKNDELDAWALADALRLDGRSWRALVPEDPMIQELRLLCRDEVALIQQRTALVNQLRAALREYYDTALQAFEDWTLPAAWALIVQFPTPEELAKAGKRKWEKFLHVHKLWRPETAQERLALFAHAADWKRSAPVTRAKSRLAVSLAKMLQMLSRQLDEYRAAIETLFQQHPDHDLFGSLLGSERQTGSTADERVGNGPGTLRHAAIAAMSGGHGPGEFSERADSSGEDAPLLQPASAARGAFVGRLQPGDVRLGTGVLQSPTRAGQKPRLRGALPWPPVVGSALENVADADPLRRRLARPQPAKTRLVGYQNPHPTRHQISVNIFYEKIICKPENISVRFNRVIMLNKENQFTRQFFRPVIKNYSRQ